MKFVCECKGKLEWIGVQSDKYKYSCKKCCKIILLNEKNPNDYLVKISKKVGLSNK